MNNERMKELFARAEQLRGEEREAVLDSELGGDIESRERLEALLAASDRLDEDAFSPLVGSAPSDLADIPDRIGPYRIESLLGRGGMACVYRATQERPIHREVAIKIVRPGFDTHAVLSRFDAERRALARLEHRNIATVLDAGADPYGPSWFAMTLVDGPPVTEYCESCELSFHERLRLFVQICRGVQHAHARGILHRDLKPSNILVSTEDGDAVPKIIDFGVAKALGVDTPLGDSQQTLETQLVGTLEYMSPEQARFGNPEVDVRSDVYALGVVLYEMLTGRVPIGGDDFRGIPLDAIQQMIFARVPAVPSQHRPAVLPADFDCVVMKALEKHAEDRYESPKDLADDIERYLNGLPIAIRPPTRVYLLRQFAKRNKAMLAAAVVIATTVLLGLAGTSIGLFRALDRERQLEASLIREQAQDRQLERLAEFQASRLGSTDLDAMAIVLRERLNGTDAFGNDNELGSGIDFTEIARRGVAEHLLRQVVRDAEAEFSDEPLLLAAVLQDAAESAAELGLSELGLTIQERALTIWAEQLGPRHEETIRAQTNRATLVSGIGRDDEAAEIIRSASSAAYELLGSDHPVTISADETRANIHRRNGEYDEAEALYRLVVMRWTQTEGAAAPRTLRSTAMLSTVLARTGKLEEAEKLARRTLIERQQTLRPDDPQVYLSHHHLGNALFRLGRYEEAEKHVRLAAEGQTAALGSRHPHSLTARGGLATLLHTKGETTEAIEIARRVLADRRASLPPEHPSIARDISNLGAMLAAAGEHDEAITLGLQSYAILSQRYGPRNATTLRSANAVGMAAAAGSDHTRSEQFYRIAYEGRRETLGVEHADTLISQRNLVGQLVKLNRVEEALRLAEDLMERAEASLPSGHVHLAVFRIERGRARLASGRFASAELDFVSASDELSARYPEGHRFVTLAHNSLTTLYIEWLEAAADGEHVAHAKRWLAGRTDAP